MSFHLVQLVVRSRLGKGKRTNEISRKAVLITLADVADDDGTGIYLSVGVIAARAACARRTVMYALGEMEIEGLIRREGSRSGGVTIWSIDVDHLERLPASAPVRPSVTRNARRNAGGVTRNAGAPLRVTGCGGDQGCTECIPPCAPSALRVRTQCTRIDPEDIHKDIQHPLTPQSVTRNARRNAGRTVQ